MFSLKLTLFSVYLHALGLQNYNKKMTHANICVIFYNFVYYVLAFFTLSRPAMIYAFKICLLSTFSNTVICWMAI
jgi:hypothetical protein